MDNDAPMVNVVTRDDALTYLGIDDTGDWMINRNIDIALNAAIEMVRGSVNPEIGKYFPEKDARIHKLILAYTAEFFESREATAKTVKAKHAWIDNLEWQLRLEIARKKREEQG